MRSPVNASPTPSRTPAHDSGPMWFATPSSWGTRTPYSLPVSRRTDTRPQPDSVPARNTDVAAELDAGCLAFALHNSLANPLVERQRGKPRQVPDLNNLA